MFQNRITGLGLEECITTNNKEESIFLNRWEAHEFLLHSEGMETMTVVAVWARVTSKHHSTNFCFVPWMAYDWAKFLDVKSYIISSSGSSFLPAYKP
nr:hypothetical protein [Tanacetum cinerariifolium]